MSIKDIGGIGSFLSSSKDPDDSQNEMQRKLEDQFNNSNLRREYEKEKTITSVGDIYRPHIVEIEEGVYGAVVETSVGPPLFIGKFDDEEDEWNLGYGLE